jgi:GT2 family glycosyltransferase
MTAGDRTAHGGRAPKVVLLILTWNRRDDVLRCVASLARSDYPNLVPIVIDNASEDDSVAALRACHPDLLVIENRTNRGYAGGNNVGLEWAMKEDAEYVQIINSDTEVTADMTSAMVRVAETDPRIAVIGCRNLLLEDPGRLWGGYGILDYGPFVVRTAGRGEPDGPRWQSVCDADWVIGNGYLWRSAALGRIGLLDENFFGYHEDVDWCVRARKAGYRIVYAGTAAILHRGGSSSDASHARRFPASYFLGRNGVLFARKHATGRQKARFAALCGGAFVVRWLRAVLLCMLPSGTRARARGRAELARENEFLHGLADGLCGRPIPFRRLGLTDAEGKRG